MQGELATGQSILHTIYIEVGTLCLLHCKKQERKTLFTSNRLWKYRHSSRAHRAFGNTPNGGKKVKDLKGVKVLEYMDYYLNT